MARLRATAVAASVVAALVVCAAPAYAAAPPTTVTGLAAAPASAQVTLTWTNPADPDFGGVVVTVDGGDPVYTGTAQTTTVTGLTNGTTYGFSVFTRNTDGDLSAPASVTATPVPAAATTLVSPAVTKTFAYYTSATLTGTLRQADTGAALSDQTVEVWRRQYGEATFRRIATTTTNASGAVTYVTPRMPKNTWWYLRYAGTPYYAASQGGTTTALVQARIAYRLSATTVEQNVPVTVYALVSPNHAGRRVSFQNYRDGAWRHVAYRTLSSTSRMSITVTSATVARRHYRIVMSRHGDHTTSKSPTFGIVTIRRTIRQGMTGDDVLSVERRLAALKYDVGTVDRYFDYDSVHATMAFQKVNRLRVTGAVDATTRAKLSSPMVPKLRYARSGSWVEADLTKQVLYVTRNGALARILDISSGNNQLFTVDGETQRAVTPTGSFRIFHKIDGMRVSRLGSLWRPAYFASGGYAIHGSGYVPAYPDSHGCIRITIPAMNRLFSSLTIGMPVFVYRS